MDALGAVSYTHLNKPYADIFTILTSYPSLENYLSPFMDAWQGGAQDQLQGQIASAKIPVSYTHLDVYKRQVIAYWDLVPKGGTFYTVSKALESGKPVINLYERMK